MNPPLNPRHPDEFLERGNARFEQGDIDGAISDYSEAMSLDPESTGPVARNNRAFAYERKGLIDKAIADYSSVIKQGMVPQIYRSYLNRGALYLDCKEYDKAISDFTFLINTAKTATLGFEINELTLFNAYSNRGLAYMSIGDIENALINYGEAIRVNSSDSDVYVNRGNAFLKKGDLDGAIVDYNRAETLNPKDFDIYFARANARAKRGELTYAIADLEKYLMLGGGQFHNRQAQVENWIREMKHQLINSDDGCRIFCLFYIKGSDQFIKPLPHAWIFDAIYYTPSNIQFKYDAERFFDLGKLNALLQTDGNWVKFSDQADKSQIYIFLDKYHHIRPEDVLQELQKYMSLIFN